ncbi:MAG: hypothetical protein O3B00_03455 [archaeon]|jgi:hypothetical protein|nr:hypothetical protein [archaeon]MDA1130538.1 hypothetical protein [archaeon]
MHSRPLIVLLSILLLTPVLSGCLSDGVLDDIIPQKKGIPGGLTMACLTNSYTELIIEIDFESGYKPETSSTDLLKQRISEVCSFSQGISTEFTETNFADVGTWSADDVREQGWDNKKADPTVGKTLRWQLIFPAESYEDDSVLGVAVDASTIAIFGESVDGAAGFLNRPSAEDVENSVMVHEVGHLLGLVNLVYTSPVNHESTDKPGHSDNDDSVMYWAIESMNVGSFISGDLPNDFDQDDKDDLAGMADGTIEVTNQI